MEQTYKFETFETEQVKGFIAGIRLFSDKLNTVYKEEGEDASKRFAVLWNANNYEPTVAIVSLDYFDEDLGWTEDDLAEIEELEVGEQFSYYSPMGNELNVQRIY